MKSAKSSKPAKKTAAPAKKAAANKPAAKSTIAKSAPSTAAKMGFKGTDSRSDTPKQQDVHDIHRDGNADRAEVRAEMPRKRG